MMSLLTFSLLYCIKQIYFVLLCVCSVIDHRRCQNVVRTSGTHLPNCLCATFLFLPHFEVFCDLLLNRHTATWNPFVYYLNELFFESKLLIFCSFFSVLFFEFVLIYFCAHRVLLTILVICIF